MQRASVFGLWIGASLALGGCMAYRAEPLVVERELATLRARDLPGVVVERAGVGQSLGSPVATFDPSDGLSEAEVVAVALALNPNLRAKRSEIGEAQSLLITAGLWPNPEVGVGLRWGIDGGPGYNMTADALFQLLRPGEREAQRQAAEARVDEVWQEIVTAEFNTAAEVREQWLDVLVAEQVAELLQEELALRQRVSDLMAQRKKLGEGTDLDVAASALELAETHRDLRQARMTLEVLRQELNRRMGLPPGFPLHLSDSGMPLALTIFESVSDEELDRRVLAGRPELRAKQAAYERAEQDLRLAILDQYPRLGIGPSYEHDLDGANSLGAAVSLELPIFNRNQGAIAAARSVRERTRGEYVALLHRLRATAFAARTIAEHAKLEVQTQEEEVLPLIQRTQELVEGALKRRDVSILEWITARQRSVRARRDYLEALARYRKSVIQLESATGLFLATPVVSNAATQASNSPVEQPVP